MQVTTCEIACDGVQLGKNHTVNMYVLKCRDVPPWLAAKARTAYPLLIIPGPRDPACGFAVFTSIILCLFVSLGSFSGVYPFHRSSVSAHRLGHDCDGALGPGVRREARMVYVPRRAVPEHIALALSSPDDEGIMRPDSNSGSVSHAESSESSGDGALSEDGFVPEEELLPVPLEAVLVSINGDFPGRSKLTGWQYPAGLFNGGWCMCLHRCHTTEV
jgi:hypothetical protein